MEATTMINRSMKSFKDYFILMENADATNKHLTHLDELVLKKGKEGAIKTLQYISVLLDMLKSNTDRKINMTVKIDGAPAIICGRDSYGKFFISTKSAFNAEPLLSYSVADIKKNHGEAPGLIEKLIYAFNALKGVNFDGAYQGDLLFWPGLVQKYVISGKNYIGFRPNTILYTFPEDSREAKDIAKYQIGVAFHTKYDPSIDEEGKQRFVNKKFGVSAEHLKSKTAFIIDALFENKAGTISLTEEETNFVRRTLQNAESHINLINFSFIDGKVADLLNIFINTKIKEGEFLTDLRYSLNEFVLWVGNRLDVEIEKVKRKEPKIAAKNEMMRLLERHADTVLHLMNFIRDVKQIKDIFIQKYNSIMQGAVMGTFLVMPNGDIKVTNPEGYVAFDQDQNGVKFIDRLEFSRANFLLPKNWVKPEESQPIE